MAKRAVLRKKAKKAKKEKVRRIKLGKRIARFFDIPEDIISGSYKVTVYGMDAARVDAHKGVFECTEEAVRFRTEDGILAIRGEKLVIMELRVDTAAVYGEIKSVEFQRIRE